MEQSDLHLEKGDSQSSGPHAHYEYGATEETKPGSRWSRMRDSFKRNPNARMVTVAVDAEGKPLPDHLQPPVQPALSMKLKDRHLQMIAIGGSIGSYHYPSFFEMYHSRHTMIDMPMLTVFYQQVLDSSSVQVQR